ncbi:unnamed protein product [Sphenostylis stenocarpa]|uniref:PARP-type domain-containing protein n=1 Tax=Sphenostylis stenocarpa TaxID=92480 RepID=A0AA86W4J9_9FABA|nr:unnamed protein product [Sphenostylis stenocarpa]
MRRFPNLVVVYVRRPSLPPLLLSVSAAASPLRNRNRPLLKMAPSEWMMVEYAKSNRSSCKVCSEAIKAKTLRLALVSKGVQYDFAKWHHLRCFPLSSHSSPSLQAIKGFSSLEISDQEALKKLFAGNDKSEEKVCKATEDIQNELQETEEPDAKRIKLRHEWNMSRPRTMVARFRLKAHAVMAYGGYGFAGGQWLGLKGRLGRGVIELAMALGRFVIG